MRLIQTTTLELVTFNNERELPAYAILSHRWVDGQEVLYKDLMKHRSQHLTGWAKIRSCCSLATENGFEYVWIDTCCIDKSSSAELSEAINSMFRWYYEAQVCYAYLNDVQYADNVSWGNEFTRSSWFTRSWTLQELLAPKKTVFYDAGWKEIGARSDLAEEIAEASGIQLSVIAAKKIKLEEYSVAQRMSWASKRNATRIEDIAYSLLGIFDVNMPLLYGEGQKAFRRLQEEIIRRTYDQTIFAWSCIDPKPGSEEVRFLDLLAPSPLAFRDDFDLVQHTFDEPTAYSITNLGLTLKAPLEPWAPNIYFVGLNCTKTHFSRVGFFLFECGPLPGVAFRISFDEKTTATRNWGKVGFESRQLTVAIAINPLQAEQLSLTGRGRHLTHVKFAHGMVSNAATLGKVYSLLYPWRGRTDDSHNVIPTIRCPGSVSKQAPRLSPGLDILLQAKLPCFGTFAIILPPRRLRSAVEAIKLGLDRNCNLVCFVADSSYREPTTGSRLCFEDSYSALWDEEGGGSFWEQSCLEERGWLLPGQEVLHHPAGSVPGVWAMKAKAREMSIFHLRLNTDHGPIGISIEIDGSHSGSSESRWSFAYVTNPYEW